MTKEKLIKFIEFIISEVNRYIRKEALLVADLMSISNDFNRLKYEMTISEDINLAIREKIIKISFEQKQIEEWFLKYLKKISIYSKLVPGYIHFFRLQNPECEDSFVRSILDEYRAIFNKLLIDVHTIDIVEGIKEV